jgi:hypothetical protein
MQERVLIISLNAQNMIVSNAKTSHHVTLSVGGSGSGMCYEHFHLCPPTKRI